MQDNYFKLISNPYKIKQIKTPLPKQNLLKDYIENKFINCDDKIINSLYKNVNNYINEINIDKLIIKSVLNDIINAID
tara:strand:- start:1025 stop:1258 length:234 start_codon:yes stop_codon:yes gene_type:complete